MPDRPSLTASSAAKVTILLCKDLAKLGSGLDLGALSASMEAAFPGVSVQVAPDLCDDLSQVPKIITRFRADRLVLGLCSGDYSRVELQSRARKAGLDPFAAEVVPLGTFCAAVHTRPQATVKAQMLLTGAVAKAIAYQGSGPDNTKLHFLPRDQKVTRRALFTVPPVGYRPVPGIIEKQCSAPAGCHLCVTSCPKEALQRSGRSVSLDKARCGSCGVCLAACPRDALDFPGWSVSQMESQLSALLESTALSQEPTGILFACEGTMDRLEALARRGLKYSHQWLPVTLPCLGMVTPNWVLQELDHGAGAVAVLSCDTRCAFGQAGIIEGRVDFCRKLLHLLGQAPDRVRLLNASHPEGVCEALGMPLACPRAGSENPSWVAQPLQLGSRSSTLQAVRNLAGVSGPLSGITLEHPCSPFGVLELQAKDCTGCLACAAACPTGALSSDSPDSETALAYAPSLCTGCGICADICPEASAGVFEVRKITDMDALSRDRIGLRQKEGATCDACGATIASHAMMHRIEALLKEGNQGLSDPIPRHCPACRMSLAWAGRTSSNPLMADS